MRVVALISGGKDSCYNMMKCVAAGHKIVALANLQPEGKDELDSFMFQTVGHEGIHLYAEAMGLPLYQMNTNGISVTREMNYDPKEGDEVEELYRLLERVVKEVEGGVEGVSSGAILSDYQRLRVENVCGRLGLVSLAYLWQRDQEELLKEMIDCGLEAIIIKVAAMGLTPEKHLGRRLGEVYSELCSLNQKYGINVCGEGGEYETFTLDCPLFTKRIVLQDSKVIMHSNDAFAPVAFLKMTEFKMQDREISEKNDHLECKLLKRACTHHTDDMLSSRHDPQAQCVVQDSYAWLLREGDPTLLSVMDQARSLFEILGADLIELGCHWSDVVLVYLYLADMSTYRDINEDIYSCHFPVNPPARVCISVVLPQGIHVRVEMLVCRSSKDDGGGVVTVGRSSMHVQSHSEWAPANIGPYSQAYTIGSVVMLAGQIGLDASSMTMVSPVDQASLALSHVKSVLNASRTSLNSGLFGLCYYTTVEAYQSAKVRRTRAD